MSWLDHFRTHAPTLSAMLDQHDYRGALTWAERADVADRELLCLAVSRQAARHWLDEACRACAAGERRRMNGALAEAARFRREPLAPDFREARRELKRITLELTVAPHWVTLLQAARDQRARYFRDSTEPAPRRYRAFAYPRLLEHAGLPRDPHQAAEAVERLDSLSLAAGSPEAVADGYPEALRGRVAELPPTFLRAALQIAGGRPDLALLDLLDLPDTHPLVCLERAKVAYALGFPSTAALALTDFARANGGHLRVRRLHTGVFLAQMTYASGDPERAVELLQALPLADVGRRPVLLLARLLRELGRPQRAQEVAARWLDPSDPAVRPEVCLSPSG